MLGAWTKAERSKSQKSEVMLRAREGCADGFEYARLEALQLAQKRTGMEHEDAAVPIVAAVVEIPARRIGIRLLEKRIHLESTRIRSAECGAAANVAIAGMCRVRFDAEQHELAHCRHLGSSTHGRDETGLVANHVVRGHNDEHSLGIVLDNGQRGNRNGCGRIARHWLQNDRFGRNTRALELVADEKTMIVVAQENRVAEPGLRSEPAQGCAEEGWSLAVEEANELLGIHGSRERPEPCA